MHRVILIIVILAVFLLGLVFHLQNDQPVVFNYYIGSIELPFSVFMVLGFTVGVIFGTVAMLSMVLRLQNNIRKLNKQIKLRDREVSNLRSIPYSETK